jgi:hypothetical protein
LIIAPNPSRASSDPTTCTRHGPGHHARASRDVAPGVGPHIRSRDPIYRRLGFDPLISIATDFSRLQFPVPPPMFCMAVWSGVGRSTMTTQVGGSAMTDQNRRSAVPLRWLDWRCDVPWWRIGPMVCSSIAVDRWEGVRFHGESVVTVTTMLIASTISVINVIRVCTVVTSHP